MTQLVPGEMIIRKNGQDRFLAVGEGLIEVTGDRVSMVTDMAVAAENIDEERAEDSASTSRRPSPGKDVYRRSRFVNAALVRSLAQLRVKRRHRK